MAINDILEISGRISAENIEIIIPEIAKHLNKYLATPLPDKPTTTDLFNSFCEGSREISSNFYVQARMHPRGRISISYNKKFDEQQGIITLNALDNGENVSEPHFEEFQKIAEQALLTNSVKPEKPRRYKEY